MKDMSRAYNFISQNFFFWIFAFCGKWQFGLFSLTFQWSCGAQRTSCWRPISTYLRSVGYSSTVTTSREFQAEMVNPLYRHSMPIIMDSLVPNQRKKQLIPESTIEPPDNEADKAGMFPVILVEQGPSGLWDLTAKLNPKRKPQPGFIKLRYKCVYLYIRFASLTTFWTQQAWTIHHQSLSYVRRKIDSHT